MEAVVALAVLLRQYAFKLVPGQTINMTTGATIHTTDGLYMTLQDRQRQPAAAQQQAAAAAAAAAAP
jgi:carotene epsilon-monooxygenase